MGFMIRNKLLRAAIIAANGVYPAGYFMPSNLPLSTIYPRPDGETSAYARHRWAYYDGVNPVTYEIPIGVSFGAPPYRFQLLSYPAGTTIGRFYGDTDYGIVKLNPQGTLTSEQISVRVTDQENNFVDLTWTVSTSDATSRFQFVGGSGANDANDGSFGSRKATLAGVWGTNGASSNFPACNVYMDSGSYAIPTTSDYGLRFNPNLKPTSLMGLPGVTATISASLGNLQTDYSDMYLSNFTLDGHEPTRDNFRMIRTGAASRMTAWKVRWTNANQGILGDDNATMFWFPNEGTYYPYIFLKECEEHDRPTGGANNYALCSIYQRQHILIEGCIIRGSPYVGAYVKATNDDVCLRYNDFDLDMGYALSLGFLSDGPSNNIEVCYNKIKTNNEFIAFPHEGGGATNVFIKRNTLYNTRIHFNSPNTDGPYEVDSNAIMASGTIVTTGSQVTITNATCHGNMSSGILDPDTLLLQGAFLANRGQIGHEIWKP